MPVRQVRPWVVITTLFVGAVLLWTTLRLPPGDDRFLPAAYALAVVWGGGAWLAGTRVHRGAHGDGTRSLGLGFLLGVCLLAASLAVALAIAHVPGLREPAQALLRHADQGALVPVFVLTAVNGVGEEMLFRGALYDMVPTRIAVPITSFVYTLTTVGSGVALLVLAAAFLGVITALLRRRTAGLLAPIATHLTWSLGMLLLLPTVLATGR